MGPSMRGVVVGIVAILVLSAVAKPQTPSPNSGEITVKLTEGMDSSTNPKAISHGQVVKSTNPAIPKGTAVLVGLGSDPVNGGYTAKLLQLLVGGQMTPAASSEVVLAPDAFGKLNEMTRAKGQPKDAVAGTRVFLPTQTVVRFTLTEPPAPTAAQAFVPQSVRASVAPQHPAPTVVDLPPALPGAPPLHASREAADGCWWEPFVSKSLGFELPVRQCSDPKLNVTYAETPTGLSYSSDHGVSEAFSVLSKPAPQSIETAIKTQFLKSAADRASCLVKKYSDTGSFQTYGVAPLHGKKSSCAGLYEDDPDATEATSFFYNPAESTTKYVKFKGEGIGIYPFDLQALHFFQTQGTNATQNGNDSNSSMTAEPSAPGAPPSLPSGPVAPVNRLNVRGISVRMGRGQILAAAKTAGMIVLENSPQQLKIVDPSVMNRTTGSASGLILLVNLQNDTALSVNIGEQGAMHGEVFQDLSKKWGQPTHLPPGYNNELGTKDKATWGDKSSVYADYNSSIYNSTAQTVTIHDAVALTPHPQARKGVPM